MMGVHIFLVCFAYEAKSGTKPQPPVFLRTPRNESRSDDGLNTLNDDEKIVSEISCFCYRFFCSSTTAKSGTKNGGKNTLIIIMP